MDVCVNPKETVPLITAAKLAFPYDTIRENMLLESGKHSACRARFGRNSFVNCHNMFKLIVWFCFLVFIAFSINP